MFKEYIKPLIVLTSICLVLAGALAVVNSMTEPVITEAAAERTSDTMREIIPNADGFELIHPQNGSWQPSAVKEVYSTTNNIGYIFIAAVKGYGGDINIICAIDNDGRIIRAQALSHTETQGIGTIIEDEVFIGTFTGADSRLEGVDTVARATVTTSAFIRAINDIFDVCSQISAKDGD